MVESSSESDDHESVQPISNDCEAIIADEVMSAKDSAEIAQPDIEMVE